MPDTVIVQGFAQLQRALRRCEDGVRPELHRRIRAIGEHIKEVERGLIPHKTGRHGEGPTIEAAMKISVQQRGASVFNVAPHGDAIEYGAWVKGKGPHISRGNASHYADRALSTSESYIREQTDAVLNWVVSTFDE